MLNFKNILNVLSIIIEKLVLIFLNSTRLEVTYYGKLSELLRYVDDLDLMGQNLDIVVLRLAKRKTILQLV